ncbi:MAG: DNA mismatch repair protein MutS [Clostridia bacterium]|nr:DNA mismatch repair protein MutS [Clostridia bacterium]
MEFKLSPMMKHYLRTKDKYKDCIVFYRLGDFYEMFFEDAVLASKILELTLTGKDCGLETRAPMCGIPVKAVDTYVQRLMKANLKVAICEQLTEAKQGEMVERDVIRVITPGTVIESSILDEKKNNFLFSVYKKGNVCGASYVDFSTGEFYLLDHLSQKQLVDEIVTIMPSEIIANQEAIDFSKNLKLVELNVIPTFSYIEEDVFLDSTNFLKQIKSINLEVKDEDKYIYSLYSCNALITYLLETQKRSIDFLDTVILKNDNQFMQLDSQARRNLEINETLNTRSTKGTLLWVIDNTKTGMGARKIKNILNYPLQREKDIKYRLNAVEELYKNLMPRDMISEQLSQIYDLERIAVKFCYGQALPKDCIAVEKSLKAVGEIKNILKDFSSKALIEINDSLHPLEHLQNEISSCINSDKLTLGIGECINKGYDKEFDELRDLVENNGKIILQMEQKEKERANAKNLKIKYNKVFGYFIEVTKLQATQIPEDYKIKQTLTNAYRYTTNELMELEQKILYANENLIKYERRIFNALVEKILTEIKQIKQTASAVAMLDVFTSLAITATKYNYVKPSFSEKSNKIVIEQGRHPVVEAIQKREPFIPNDTILDDDENRTMIITGPNMAGKSTYMRQVALITLLSHIGSFVPCKKCEMCLVDKIFTRIGASDDLLQNQSTFMVEMTEVSEIVSNCTDKSLILLDEVGRGTSTFDGMSIASSVMEYLSKHVKAKTLFSTHYHELTNMEGVLSGVKNYRINVRELNGNIIFLRKIVRGGANRSFGIEVAAMAGLPKEVIDRAKEIMNELIQERIDTSSKTMDKSKPQINYGEVINMIKEIDINRLTPLDSFQLLVEICQKVDSLTHKNK